MKTPPIPKKTRAALLLGLVLAAIMAVLLLRSASPAEPKQAASAAPDLRETATSVAEERPGALPGLAEQEGDDAGGAPQDFGAWVTEKTPEPDFSKIEAFEGWLGRWVDADEAGRAALIGEGVELAAERREEFKRLIVHDPKLALELAVSRVIRQDLPEEIAALLEKPVSATGDYDVLKGRPAPGAEVPDELTLRYFEAEGMSYKARVFGEMEPVMSRKGIPLRGVSVDREFAVAESPLRALEIGERIPAGTVVEEICPVSEEETTAVAQGEAVTEESPTVEVGERIITLCNGEHVAVLDEKYRVLVQAAGPGGPAFYMDAFPGTASRAIGNLRCLYIRATYPDQMAPPNTEDQAAADMANTSRYFLENSYGKCTVTSTVTPLIVLPQTLSWYIAKDAEVNGLGVLQSQARAEARKLGYDPTYYDCIILRVNGGLRSGSSWGGGDSVWLGWGGMDVINHEVGHSLGLGHANYWNTSDGTAYGNGSNQEYGNSFDVMGGAGGFSAHYNTISKRHVGWLPASYVHFPKTNGVFRIHAYDQPRLEEGKRYGLNVAKDSIRAYNIEYHPARGGQLADSALVLYNGMGSNAGHLLDTTPGSSGGKNDGGIHVGRTFSDHEADMHFTVLAKNDTSPPSLDVAYFRGPFPGNQAPEVALNASATSIAVGGSVTFTADATDADGDELAYHWEFDDGATAPNSAVVTRGFSSAAQITAMVTVSDMKGGSTRRHVVINVGSHGRQTVSGAITWNGQPLPDVRVSGGGKSVHTDASGNYALAGLTTGSQSLTATLNGFTFTPQFTNPLNVVSGTNTANWTADASSVLVTLANTADAHEGGANGSFTLTRTGDTSSALTVRVSPPGGTAVKGTDYSFSPDFVNDGSYRTFTIPAGQASLVVTVAAVNDSAVEGPETITLQLASNGNYLSLTPNAAVMTVVDNNTTLPQVAVSAVQPYALENPAVPGVFRFTRSGSTAASLNIAVAWSGSAANGADCTTLPSTVTIPAGQSSVLVNVNPIDDVEIEGPEDVIATISTNAAYVRDGSATTATVHLTDDDVPVVTVSVPDAIASETGPESGMFLIHRSGSTAAPLKVYYGLTGSAYHGTDYAALTGEVVIPAGQSSAAVMINPYADDLGEGDEAVVLALTTFNNAYSVGEPHQGTVIITEGGDVPVISVRAGTTGVEGGSNPTVIFRSLGSNSGNVTLNYTVSGTATSGVDFTALPGSITIPAGGPADVTLTIPILNDTIPEPTETVVVEITPSNDYRVYNDGVAEAVIRDNDSGDRVMVSAYHDSPSENGATGRFHISRAGSTANAMTVDYQLSGTATPGVDHTGLSGSAVIPAGESGVVVTFTPVNDTLVEGTETVTLTIVAGTGYGVDRPASATLEIADNDVGSLTVGFQSSASTTTEQSGPLGEYRDIPVVLSSASAETVTVNYVSGGGTAMGDDVDWAFVDATNGNAIIPGGTLTFAPGTTSRNIRIRVKNDGVAEPIESIVLELRSPHRASLTAGLNRHTIMVGDDSVDGLVLEERWNGGTVYTNQTWNSVTPNHTGFLTSFTPGQNVADNYSRRLTGHITAPVTGAYTFWIASDDASRLYLSTDDTSANKAQIAGVSGYTSFQNWDANTSQKSAVINLTAGQSYYMEVQHQEGGGGDHVSVAWEGPGFSRQVIPSQAGESNAPRFVRMAVASSSRFETDGSEPLLMAVLDRPAGSTALTVDYSAGGTATPGEDFILTPGTLVFAPGEQTKPIPLTLLADSAGEAPEAIVVSLSNPSGAALAAPSTHTVTLYDADAPVVDTVTFTATSAMSAGASLGTAGATPASGRTITGWSIAAGNEGGLFAISASGQVSLQAPGALPSPGTRQLLVRATDSAGATGDGFVNIICNPPAFSGVREQRWSGSTAYNNQNWTGTPNHTGTLATYTTPQGVADSYSRRLTGYLQPQVSGNYTFWIASDDASRLFISTDETEANKSQIAGVSGYTSFQNWDANASQKSATIPLVAGQVYWLEVHHQEGGGGDHASVAWSGPGISRQAIPASAIFPSFGTSAPAPAMVALTSPSSGAIFDAGDPIALTAEVVAGTQTVTTVEFYNGSTLIGSDSSAPYAMSWSGAPTGTHTLTARAVTAGGSVTSSGVGVTVENADIDLAGDPDGDGFPTGLELAVGADPDDANSTPDPIYANLRAWWKLDETSGTTAVDSTGRPQDGAVTGAVWSTGISGGALSFDGVDDGVLAGTSAAMLGATDFTLSAWVKVNPGSPTGTLIQQREPGSTGYQGEYMLNVNGNGTVNFFVYGTSAHQFNLTSTATVNNGEWRLVTAVRQGSAGRIYIDGVEVASGSGTVQNLLSRAVSLGYDHRDSNKRFPGSMDDVRVYERALSAVEIDGLHDDLVPNRVPVFAGDPLVEVDATQDAAYSGGLAAAVSDPDFGDTLVFSKSSGPAWLSVAPDGTLSGTPGNDDVGLNLFTVRATDGGGLHAEAGLSIEVLNVNDAPVFTVDPIVGTTGAVGAAYSGTLAGSASDIDAGDTLTYSKVSGPAWLSIAANGALTGTPALGDAGLNVFTVRVTDSGSAMDEAELQISVTSPLAAHWAMEENTGTTTADSSGNGNDAAITGATWAAPRDGVGALAFNGTSSQYAQAPSLNPSGGFTITAWVKPVNAADQNRTILSEQNSYAFKVHANGMRFTTPGTKDHDMAAGLVSGQWAHVAVSFTPGAADGARFYKNGVLLGTVAASSISNTTNPTRIGGTLNWTGQDFNGALDDVRVYAVALGDADIAAIHSSYPAAQQQPSAPQFAANPLEGASATQGAAYAGSLAGSATDADEGAVLVFSKVSGPAWLNVTPDGTLSGTPGNDDVGPNNFVVRVTDETELSDETTLAITVINVNDAPAFLEDPVAGEDATQDEAYSSTLAGSAADIDADETLSYSKVSGPAWLQVAGDGTLSGTPGNDDVGANTFTVRVTDAGGLIDEAELSITVLNMNDAPVFTANSIAGADALEDTVYAGSLAASASDPDADDTLLFAKISGPAWLAVAADGSLTGTPSNSDVGANAFIVRVTDAGGLFSDAVLNIAVINVNDAPVFTVNPVLASGAVEGEAYSGFSLAGLAVDPDAGDGIVFAKVSGPDWLAVSGAGLLSGTPGPGSAGLNTFVVRATDGAGAFGEAELRIGVQGLSLPLPWEEMKIGTSNLAGSASFADQTFTLSGSGTLSGSSDGLQYIHQTLSGDGQIIARVKTTGSGGNNARVGVMIRDSLAANSRHASMTVNGNGGWRWTRRTSTGGSTSTTNSSSGSAPDLWVALVRSGNTIHSYRSTNGSSWTSVGSVTMGLASNCHVGLVVASGSNTTTTTAEIDNVHVIP